MTNAKQTAWRKSSYSSGGSAMCVEVRVGSDRASVRDSKFVVGPVLGFTTPAWRGFVADIAAGHAGEDLMPRHGAARPTA